MGRLRCCHEAEPDEQVGDASRPIAPVPGEAVVERPPLPPRQAANTARSLALVARFPHVYSIKRGLRRFGPDELRAFLARESEQELDLLLARRG